MARATRADVARAAGVSPSTVSVVLNGQSEAIKISVATQKKVREAAKALKYIPHASARALRRQRSNVIGLVLGKLPRDPFVPVVHQVLISAVKAAQERGFLVVPVPEPQEADGTYNYTHKLLSEINLSGLVFETTSRQQFVGTLLSDIDVPVMWMSLVDTQDRYPGVGHMRIKEQSGVKELVDGLGISAESSVLLLTGPGGKHSRQNPVIEYFGINCRQVSLEDWSVATARTAVGKMLSKGERPRVIWCADDMLAIGAREACQAAGVNVPDEIMVIGFGDYSESSFGSQGITSAHWPLQQLTEGAVNGLIDYIEQQQNPDAGNGAEEWPRYRDYPTTAVWRESASRAAD
ncbi:LacI family transcriptional regulator [Dermabacteraceae bacterium TAE3-ERU27]|nr:LacI family transcriptional regulator [Dermabacteraceae bacterium TAE3-ERU27]